MTKMLKISDELYEALQILKPHARASFDEVIRSLITSNENEDIQTAAFELKQENAHWREEARKHNELDEYLERKMAEVDEHVKQRINEIEIATLAKVDAWTRGEIELDGTPVKNPSPQRPPTSKNVADPATKKSVKK